MTVWVALLRGVNVGGHRRVPMADLRRTLEARGATGVRTYLQSGNAVFRLPVREASKAADLAKDAVADLGVECDVLVRSAAELADVVARNPWPERAGEPTLLHVGFLSGPATGEAKRLGPDEEVRFDGQEVWVWFAGGAGRSKLSLDVGDRVLTMRNWRTVQALVELAEGLSDDGEGATPPG